MKTKIVEIIEGRLMNRLFLSMFSFLILIADIHGEQSNIKNEIEKFLEQKKYNGKGIGIVIQDVDNGKEIVSINGDEMLNPASVAKLVTGAAALELLGCNYTFSTKVYIDGTFNTDSGIVKGNLYIRGGGDPGFTAERIWLFTQHLYHLGIRNITGNLVLDDYFFDSVTVGPGFDDDNSSRAYLPLISALSSSFNTIAIHHRTGAVVGSPVYVDIFPKINGIKVVSNAKTAATGKSGIDIKTVATNLGTDVIVNGIMGLGELPRYTYRKVWQTWEIFGGAIMAQLDELGIKVAGNVLHATTPESLVSKKPLYSFSSEPLSVCLNAMFKFSNNFSSEMVYKTLSATDTNPGSWPKSSITVAQWWKKQQLPGQLSFQNGSGLGDVNRISARQISALLQHVWDQKSYLPEYLCALSQSGIDGTLKSRFKNSKLKGIVRAKTGTINTLGVSSMAGYLLKSGKTYAFAIICNKVGDGQYDNWMVQEGILELFNSLIN